MFKTLNFEINENLIVHMGELMKLELIAVIGIVIWMGTDHCLDYISPAYSILPQTTMPHPPSQTPSI